jgi:hypothetical protein
VEFQTPRMLAEQLARDHLNVYLSLEEAEALADAAEISDERRPQTQPTLPVSALPQADDMHLPAYTQADDMHHGRPAQISLFSERAAGVSIWTAIELDAARPSVFPPSAAG